MSWNWNVVFKSVLFWFLGVLTGIFLLMIYLAVDVDSSKIDGTLITTLVLTIATAVLAGATIGLYLSTNKLAEITAGYAESTKDMLDEQRSSIKRDRLFKEMDSLVGPLYSGTDFFLKNEPNPNIDIYQPYIIFWNDIKQNKYLAVTEDLRIAIENYLEYLKKRKVSFNEVRDELIRTCEKRYLELQKMLK